MRKNSWRPKAVAFSIVFLAVRIDRLVEHGVQLHSCARRDKEKSWNSRQQQNHRLSA